MSCGRFEFTLRDDAATSDALVDAAIDTPVGMACVKDSDCGRCARCDGTCKVEPITDLFLGHRSTCYIGAGGTRWCAGDNLSGQLGLGDMTSRATPERVTDGDGWERIALFYYGFALGVRGTEFYRWGNGTLSPMATGASRTIRAALGDLYQECIWEQDGTAPTCPGAGPTVWRSLDFGAGHFCGVKEADQTLWCWGTSFSNALGIAAGDGAVIAAPQQVGTDTDWDRVGTGGRNAGPNAVDFTGSTCARKTNGAVYCFGHPSLTGTNGVGGATPTVVDGGPYTFIDVDWQHACAGKADGTVWCWGADTYGGYVAPGLMASPVPVKLDGTYQRWIMGGHHACGQTGGRWKCMGWNEDGQLANGTIGGTGNLVDLCP